MRLSAAEQQQYFAVYVDSELNKSIGVTLVTQCKIEARYLSLHLHLVFRI